MLTEIWEKCESVEIDYKGARETFQGDKNALYLVLGGSHRDIYNYQNSLNEKTVYFTVYKLYLNIAIGYKNNCTIPIP